MVGNAQRHRGVLLHQQYRHALRVDPPDRLEHLLAPASAPAPCSARPSAARAAAPSARAPRPASAARRPTACRQPASAARAAAGTAPASAPCPSAIARRSRRVNAPISRFSLTVSRPKMRRPSGTCTTPIAAISCAPSPASARPSKRIAPWRGCSSPLIARSVVDLPAPLPPTSVTICRSSHRERDALQRLDLVVEHMDVVDLQQRHRRYAAALPR